VLLIQTALDVWWELRGVSKSFTLRGQAHLDEPQLLPPYDAPPSCVADVRRLFHNVLPVLVVVDKVYAVVSDAREAVMATPWMADALTAWLRAMRQRHGESVPIHPVLRDICV